MTCRRLFVGLSGLIFALAFSPVSFAGGSVRGPAPMSAADRKRIDAEMLKLDFPTRVEQRCNARAMGIVRREHWPMNPDEGVVRAFAEPEENGTTMRAEGAAIRSGGQWYRIAFDCETTDNALDIRSFRYSLGQSVPKSEWKAHELVEP